MIALKSIVVATDFGEASGAALAYGRELARTFGATLHVLHVADDVYVRLGGDAYMAVLPELQKDLEVAAQKQLDELLVDNDPVPLPVKTAVLTSSATASAIVQYARDNRAFEGGVPPPTMEEVCAMMSTDEDPVLQVANVNKFVDGG